MALGDSVGLPMEGLSPQRAARLFPPPHGQRLIFGRGMVSDDTEHACMTAQALIASAGEPRLFQRDLARRLRWWLAAVPAGVGMATAKSILRLWVGVPPRKSGVRSAGNGAAMRAPVIGAFARSTAELAALVEASTVITHRDERALHGALAVGLAAHHAARAGRIEPAPYLDDVITLIGAGSALADPIRAALDHLDRPTEALAAKLGLRERGVSGFILHTAPVALHAGIRHQGDVRGAVSAVLALGGDTDTVAALAAGVSGSIPGSEVPSDWAGTLAEWPRSNRWIASLSDQLHRVATTRTPERPRALPPLAVLPRNLVFLTLVLGHGARRLLPPY